jgi:hypothetical protein
MDTHDWIKVMGKHAPLWWYRWWSTVTWAICEALFILDIPLPTEQLAKDWGNMRFWWCGHVHAPVEFATSTVEYERTHTSNTANVIVIPWLRG